MNYENSTLSLGMFPLKQVMSKNYQHYPNWDTTGKGKMAWVCIIQTFNKILLDIGITYIRY